jgi:hypothetical protein
MKTPFFDTLTFETVNLIMNFDQFLMKKKPTHTLNGTISIEPSALGL